MAENEWNGLPAQSMEWLQEQLGAAAELASIKPLTGGTSSTLFELDVREKDEIRSYVLRLFHKADWLEKEPDLARHEADSLQFAEQAGLPVPHLIAYDETGEASEVPAVLMTKLSGSVVLQPSNDENWLEGLAASLAHLHKTKPEGFPYEYFSYNNAFLLEKPTWSKVQNDWMRAFYIVAGSRPEAPECFIHRDFHPANVLWENGRVSAIVDWVNACRGPAGIDVGHCRVNLAQLYGTSVANDFLAAYERHAGSSFTYDPYWDLVSLTDTLDGSPVVYPGWKAFGMTGLSNELMRHRLDDYLLSLLDRFDDF
ncbi:aminoglycoside phosphotransferase (APT) family kinase protein [Planomicrobium stackebrandtii]|uniref:Aminoglycoside phosphotransferase (APT) family kinase protein n=1 Tax=Planomicrobium stackebrandtii TaxID=253160 RepID=A0ABU0GWY2_9BACL|nr:aminoglycoside phosphotransferase family protein [Planomicrobium stackebrandtii]MDQ0429886.1 aminoglycoside phosphotransferase (APT) family kinase protein [Planomicrobium stackebrandtii]